MISCSAPPRLPPPPQSCLRGGCTAGTCSRGIRRRHLMTLRTTTVPFILNDVCSMGVPRFLSLFVSPICLSLSLSLLLSTHFYSSSRPCLSHQSLSALSTFLFPTASPLLQTIEIAIANITLLSLLSLLQTRQRNSRSSDDRYSEKSCYYRDNHIEYEVVIKYISRKVEFSIWDQFYRGSPYLCINASPVSACGLSGDQGCRDRVILS